MKTMTKRDIADIALICMGLSFAHSFLNHIAWLLGRLTTEESPTFNWGPSLALSIFQTLVILFATYILLFKRNYILNLILPHAAQTEMQVSDGCATLTNLEFWIRLLGTYKLIQAVIELASNLAMYFPASKNLNLGTSFIWATVIPALFRIPLALLVIWKAMYIANMMNKLGESNNRLHPTRGS